MSPAFLVAELVAAGAACFVVWGIVHASRDPFRRRTIAALLVGVTAGLQAVQVSKIHAFIPAVLWFAIVAGRAKPRNLTGPLILLIATALLASTALYGPFVNNKFTAGQLVLFAIAALVVALCATPIDMVRMRTGLLAVNTFASAVAIGQYVGVLPLSLFNGASRPNGIIYTEPDFLGLYAAIGALLALRSGLRPRVMGALFAVNAAAMLLSGARAAWISLGLAVLLTLVLRRRNDVSSRGVLRVVIVGAATLALILTADGKLRTYTVTRIESAIGGPLSNTAISSAGTDLSAQARRNQSASLHRLANMAPWYGAGLTASGRVLVFGGVITGAQSPNNIGSNWVLSWWAEGKILAVPLIGFLIFAALRRARDTEGAMLGLILINDLFSDANLQPILWFAVAATFVPRLVEARRVDPKPVVEVSVSV